MAKTQVNSNRKTVVKRTSQGGPRPKTSSMNKHQRCSYKQSRGQGQTDNSARINNTMRAREFVINVPITIKINGDGDPEVAMDQGQGEPELDSMVPPLQQKMELLKRNAGLPNVYDEQADDDDPLE